MIIRCYPIYIVILMVIGCLTIWSPDRVRYYSVTTSARSGLDVDARWRTCDGSECSAWSLDKIAASRHTTLQITAEAECMPGMKQMGTETWNRVGNNSYIATTACGWVVLDVEEIDE